MLRYCLSIFLTFSFLTLWADEATPYSHLEMTDDERDAMEFLYRYLPLPDEAGYAPEFWLENVRASLKAREEMPWGKSVPEREWKHFVLPVRVNNESLDNSRTLFYEELKERVKGMTMEEAILETNHWLHEKATYRPSDGRTSSPLSTVSQAIGRCGEESTLGVAAFRSIGIPARQVYTPRWAHTDDNHAWVEVWADGKWHFLGACEPEPVLDLAWFNAPASRGMMMNTNVFGDYDGPEEVLERTDVTTRINVTSNYAPVRTVRARAVDTDGNPIKDADISFCIYNYAEYYPVSTKKSNADGMAETIAGVGDMVVWAMDGKRFGFAKASPSDSGPVDVVLSFSSETSGTLDLDITPPKGGTTIPAVSAEMRAENDRRFAYEDSVRSAYTSRFVSCSDTREIASRLGVNPEIFSNVINDARGNGDSIIAALESLDPSLRSMALDILTAVSEKDRRDIPGEVIRDAAIFSMPRPDLSEELFIEYVANPRIESEGLTPWRQFLMNALQTVDGLRLADSPDSLDHWVKRNISVSSELNPQNLRMSPISVWNERRANAVSRDIFYVAMSRTLGIPARIDPVTGAVERHDGNDWICVSFDENSDSPYSSEGFGWLALDFTPSKSVSDPKYYSSFSISRIENGVARQLEWPEDATWSSTFSEPVRLETGQYILTSGQRLADGGVLAHSSVFTISRDATTKLPLEIRNAEGALQVIGSLDAETLYHDLDSDTDKSILSTTGRGYYTVALINPGHEPSAHVLNDLAAVASGLEADGRKILALFASSDDASRFDRSLFKGLPKNLVFGVDIDGKIASQLKESLHLNNDEMPLVAMADSFNRVVFYTQGYVIGTGETLLRNLHSLD